MQDIFKTIVYAPFVPLKVSKWVVHLFHFVRIDSGSSVVVAEYHNFLNLHFVMHTIVARYCALAYVVLINCSLQTYEDAKIHLICDGFLKGYTSWVCHGEEPLSLTSSINTVDSTSTFQPIQEVSHVEEYNPITQNFG
ncbi:hypothetical protein ACMD2_13510, partial [Ananas comosus]